MENVAAGNSLKDPVLRAVGILGVEIHRRAVRRGIRERIQHDRARSRCDIAPLRRIARRDRRDLHLIGGCRFLRSERNARFARRTERIEIGSCSLVFQVIGAADLRRGECRCQISARGTAFCADSFQSGCLHCRLIGQRCADKHGACHQRRDEQGHCFSGHCLQFRHFTNSFISSIVR